MFNDVNNTERLLKPIRGRVLVQTDSRSVEYLNKDLDTSFPMFYYTENETYPRLHCLVFEAEAANGFLTFEPGSQVKILETAQFTLVDLINIQNFKVVRPADPFLTPITYSSGGGNTDDSGNQQVISFIAVSEDGNNTQYAIGKADGSYFTPAEMAYYLNGPFAVGQFFKGFRAYPGLTRM